MKIVVLHNAASEDAAVEERDVLIQRDAVAAALVELGHESVCVACTLDLAALRSRLMELRPDAVFNLVESLGGTDRLMPLATLLLDALGLPYTGSPTAAMFASNDKLAAKRRMRDAKLPTPAWFTAEADGNYGIDENYSSHESPDSHSSHPPCQSIPTTARRGIIKAVWEHASFGIGDDCVIELTPNVDLIGLLCSRQAASGRPHFIEEFIDGRELNLSMLAGVNNRPQVLPPAEIDFNDFPADKPRIVGYLAKWDEGTFEYQQTVRRFEFPAADRKLLDELAEIAANCWELFGLRGYARVDFRVDPAGKPWILEVNTNPCLAPDAGLAAALARGEIQYSQAIARILADALRQSPARVSDR